MGPAASANQRPEVLGQLGVFKWATRWEEPYWSIQFPSPPWRSARVPPQRNGSF
jgi:hypothetical protein